MPPIARYHGIIIIINSGREHPPPHIHVKYQEYRSTIDIKTGTYSKNKKNMQLPKKAHKFVLEWLDENRNAALEQWERMERGEKIQFIGPRNL